VSNPRQRKRPRACLQALHAAVRAVFVAPDRRRAGWGSPPPLRDCQAKNPKAVATGEAGVEDALAILVSRRRFRSTNDRERIRREIRRWERVIRILPHRASAERRLGVLLMKLHEGRSTRRGYVNLETFWAKRGRAVAEGHVSVRELGQDLAQDYPISATPIIIPVNGDGIDKAITRYDGEP
jgi:hypothetical protein